MFDLRAIRENPDQFKADWNRKKAGLGDGSVGTILSIDEELRAAVTAKQDAEKIRNDMSKLIGAAKAKGDDAEFERLRIAVADAKIRIEGAGATEEKLRAELDGILMGLPNLPLAVVPEGTDESGNVQHGEAWGTPKGINDPKDHADLGADLKDANGFSLMDFEAAAAMSGARFVALRGKMARLERALAAFMLDVQTEEHGYQEVSPPLLVRDEALVGTGQLPKFSEDLFPVPATTAVSEEFFGVTRVGLTIFLAALNQDYGFPGADRFKPMIAALSEDQRMERIGEVEHMLTLKTLGIDEGIIASHTSRYLIPTAEVPLTNLVREQILEDAQLPLRFTAHTPCFRSEAGSAGRDTKGMIRLHQFNKVEMVSIVRNEAEGLAELERMTECAEAVLKKLDLPFKRMLLCAGDMGAGARKTYDLEVWLPSQNTYREISSCSYCGDFQARRMEARYRPEAIDGKKSKPEYVHTLNGSGLAVGRTLVAVLENYQLPDGSVKVPDVLVPYMGGMTVIETG